MPWRINQVELVRLTIMSGVREAHSLGLNRDAPLTLKVELIEKLRLHLTRLESSCRLKDTIREGRLAVVNVRNNTEISNLTFIYHMLPF
jgi:hypothetical protein